MAVQQSQHQRMQKLEEQLEHYEQQMMHFNWSSADFVSKEKYWNCLEKAFKIYEKMGKSWGQTPNHPFFRNLMHVVQKDMDFINQSKFLNQPTVLFLLDHISPKWMNSHSQMPVLAKRGLNLTTPLQNQVPLLYSWRNIGHKLWDDDLKIALDLGISPLLHDKKGTLFDVEWGYCQNAIEQLLRERITQDLKNNHIDETLLKSFSKQMKRAKKPKNSAWWEQIDLEQQTPLVLKKRSTMRL